MASRRDNCGRQRSLSRKTDLPAWIDVEAHVFLTICARCRGADPLCRNNRATQLQRGYFDRRLRRTDSLKAKIAYIRQNPVRAGLMSHPDDWPYLWIR